MRQIPKSAIYVVTFKAFLASDHIGAATGKTIAIVISKAGGAFANPNVGATNATEIANGWYKVSLDVVDTGTLGDLIVRGTEGTIDPAEQIMQVSDVVSTLSDIDMEVEALSTQIAGIPGESATATLEKTDGIETSWSLQQSLRVILGVLAGVTTGMGTTAAVLRNPANTKSRVSATVDASGNRSAITYDKT